MSYHRFSNLREILRGDLTTKLNANIGCKDFETLPCNCQGRRATGCNYNDVCRQSIVVYKVTCNSTNKVYIGNTQQKLKTRMQQHIKQVKDLRVRGKRSDSFAAHFAEQLINFDNPSSKLIRNLFTISVLWKGNPLQAVKTFATPRCVLCNRERLEIIRRARYQQDNLINSHNEIYGACRHKPRFHRYCKLDSTDEPTMGERTLISV